MFFPVDTEQNLNSNHKIYAIKIRTILLDLEAKFLRIKMRLLVDIRFVPLDGKPNIIKFEQVSSFSNPNYKMRKLVLLGTFAKLRIATFSFVMSVSPSVRVSVSPHGTTWLPLDGFS